jgi:uncharacterized protein YraI
MRRGVNDAIHFVCFWLCALELAPPMTYGLRADHRDRFVGEELTMRISSRMLGAALLVAAAITPAFAQQDAPAAGQAPPANGPSAPQQGASPGPSAIPPLAAPGGPGRSAVVAANVNLRSGPGTDSEILATIPAGSRVRVSDCSEWCMVTWKGQSGFAVARNLDIGGARQARGYRPPPAYAGGPPVYEAGPPMVYGPPVYYPPPAVVYGAPYYYGPRYYGWHRRWWR